MLSKHLRITQMSQVKQAVSYVVKLPSGKWSTYQRLRACQEAIRRDILPGTEIKVSYGKGITNTAEVDDYKTAAAFLRECTEPALLKFIKEGKW